MTNFLKDIFEAANSRINSPFLGSIFLVFLAANWKPIFYVLFAEQPVSIRLRFFELSTDQNTLFFIPLILGVILAICAPWLKFLGAWLAKSPKRFYRFLQDEEDHLKRINELEILAKEEAAKADIEEARAEIEESRARNEEAAERRKIDAAKRLEEIRTIADDEVRENLEQDIEDKRQILENENFDNKQGTIDLSNEEISLLKEIAETVDGSVDTYEIDRKLYIRIGGQSRALANRKALLETEKAISILKKIGYLSRGRNGDVITAKAFEFLQTLK